MAEIIQEIFCDPPMSSRGSAAARRRSSPIAGSPAPIAQRGDTAISRWSLDVFLTARSVLKPELSASGCESSARSVHIGRWPARRGGSEPRRGGMCR